MIAAPVIKLVGDIRQNGSASADYVAGRILDLLDEPVVVLEFDSLGGDIRETNVIAGLLQMYEGAGQKFVAHVVGAGASAASWLALGSSEVLIAKSRGWIGLHNVTSGAASPSNEEQIALYVARTGHTRSFVAALLGRTSRLGASAAVALGFADRVVPDGFVVPTSPLEKSSCRI